MANQHEIDILTTDVKHATEQVAAVHGEPAKAEARVALVAAQKALEAAHHGKKDHRRDATDDRKAEGQAGAQNDRDDDRAVTADRHDPNRQRSDG